MFKWVMAACLFVLTLPGQGHAFQNRDDDDREYWGSDHWNGLTHSATFHSEHRWPSDFDISRLRVQWEEKYDNRLGYNCVWIRGHLQVIDDDQTARAVDWYPGIRVLLARSPDDKPDWGTGHNQKDTVVSDLIVRDDGSFSAEFELGELERSIGSKELFQVGITLGEHNGREVIWRAEDPLLRGSQANLIIPGPPVLSPTLKLINSASHWPKDGCDGVALIRAVNHLQTLGKERALAALEDYARLGTDGYWNEDALVAENIETGNHEVVFWIIRLLFEPIRAGERIPLPMIHGVFGAEQDDSRKWPLFPVEVVNDVPFMVEQSGGSTGIPEHPLSHIQWARRYAVLRPDPLRPTSDPLAAADLLISLPKWQRLRKNNTIRLQAWRMVENLLPIEPPEEEWLEYQVIEREWSELRRKAQELKIQWDPSTQAFIVENGDRSSF